MKDRSVEYKYLAIRRYMFLAVASHKFVIAFCIGVELLASRTKTYLSVIYTCTFAVVSPIGIGVGMGLVGGGSPAASGSMAVILQASFSIFQEPVPVSSNEIKSFDEAIDDCNTRVVGFCRSIEQQSCGV